ncbi:DsbA family protein, partial [bacterium]|nr:DsbA family protein [bacterium]
MNKDKNILSASIIVLILIVLSFLIYNIVYNIDIYNKKRDFRVIESQTDEEYKITTFINDPINGSKTAPINLYFFGNYETSESKQGLEIIKQILKKYPEKVNLAWKDLPYLDEGYFKSGINIATALAGKCALEQDKYWEFSDYLFKEENLGFDYYTKIAQDLGMDVGKFILCYNSRKYLTDISYNVQEAKVLRIDKIPTLFI